MPERGRGMDPHANVARTRGGGFIKLAQLFPLFVLLAGTIVATTLLSPRVWLVVLTDGLYAVAIIVAAAGWGAWLAVPLGMGRRPAMQQFCIATALGLGLLSTLTLVTGVTGLLGRVVAWGLVAGGIVSGLLRVARARAAAGKPPARTSGISDSAARPSWSIVGQSMALLPLCVPLAIALFGASLPPGWLWTGEARGYDVLEYHLQVPREYFEAGRIRFLPHNVYASFPQQVEMLYLLLMHLLGGALPAAIPAQLLHAALGILTVLALAAWAAPGWPRVLVVIVSGSVPWLAYLGCLAYVELGMLFFTAVAGGLALEAHRSPGNREWRVVLATGVCAGLAGGCKYTALGLVVLPLGGAALLTIPGALRARVGRLGLFAVGALAAVSPWLIRNGAFTGNPVYPFAYGWFDGAAWSEEQAAQWARGHRLSEGRASAAGRLGVAVDELLATRMIGPAAWVVSAAALLLGRRRRPWFALLWLLLLVGVWATATHMPGRFLVPVVVPMVLLVSDAALVSPMRRVALGGLVLIAAAGAVNNAVTLLGLLRADNAWWLRQTSVRPEHVLGDSGTFVRENLINQTVREPDAYVWLVGDAAVFYLEPRVHYTVVFSRDLWLVYAAAAASPAECMAWLRTRNVTHVVFSWSEIERLRRTYGFSPVVTRAWAKQLVRAGLRWVGPREYRPGTAPLEIYEVAAE